MHIKMLKKLDLLKKSIKSAIKEDVGKGDITTSLLISKKLQGKANILVKEQCILAGIEICKMVCNEIDKKIKVKTFKKDGEQIKKDTIIAILEGPVASLLVAERIMLNYLQRMCGIASKTHKIKKLIGNDNIKILDTRKTTPNLRVFEKYAVKMGGGKNHRMGLYDEILVKDNHIEANDGIINTLEKLKKNIGDKKIKTKIIVEIKNIDEFKITLKYSFIDRILLDNLTPNEIKKIVKLNRKKKILEVSGGINQINIIEYAIPGVDFISIGELTHHIESIDISMNIIQ
jgi:nicotinate-nucleotide pyrophosphorylase (carboxylating)